MSICADVDTIVIVSVTLLCHFNLDPNGMPIVYYMTFTKLMVITSRRVCHEVLDES